MKERIRDLIQAISIEREAELNRFSTLLEDQTIKARISEGLTLYPIKYLNEGYSNFEELMLEFSIHPDQDPYQFSANGKVQLFTGHGNETVNGIVSSYRNGQLSIICSEGDTPDWIKSGKLGLNALPDTRTWDIQLKTLERILAADDLPIAKKFYAQPAKQDYSIAQIDFNGFNPSQNAAISALLSENPFHIVHGPPGTGKTKTLVKAILQLAAQGKRVLVAAPSNAAVDHITRSISTENSAVVRIGNSFKISEDVQPYTLKNRIVEHQLMDVVRRLKKDAEAIRKRAFKYKRNFGKEEYQERKQLRRALNETRKDIRQIERDIAQNCIEKAQIITGTFMGLQDYQLKQVEFDAIFVDEAGQALEPAIWAIAHYAPKLFLAGDPLQLPPTLFSPEAKKLGLGISLIEKGIELGIPTTLLNVQYRMNAKIMQFSNDWFYGSALSAAKTVSDICLENETFLPIEFIDTAGCGFDEKKDESGGISNLGELDMVQKRLAESDVSGISIGIISPYRKQVQLLKETLSNHVNDCQTIDSFQGQERDLIILSLVRSNEKGTIGFLADYRRMNVAMTRAKKKLILIGDSATIGTDHFYQKLLDYIEQNGTYRSAWEFLT